MAFLPYFGQIVSTLGQISHRYDGKNQNSFKINETYPIFHCQRGPNDRSIQFVFTSKTTALERQWFTGKGKT